MRMNSVLPAVLFIAWFIRRAARQARLLEISIRAGSVVI